MRTIGIALTALFLAVSPAQGETIYLKSDKIIQGEIVERTDDYIAVDVGIERPITFYQDEIESIVTDPQVEEAPPPPAQGRHFLWKATSPSTHVYVFGSIHLGKPQMYPLDPVIEEAFAQSSYLVVEVNVEALNPLAAQQTVMAKGLYTNGDRLENNISGETLRKFKKQLQQYGLTFEPFAFFKPWFAAMTLTLIQVKQLGFNEEYGVDKYFIRKALGRKDILELETLDEQLDFLDQIEDQDSFLDYSLGNIRETEKVFSEMLTAWKTGDVGLMERVSITDIVEEDPDSYAVLESILFDRNVTMTDQIRAYLDSNKVYFVVVGAAHLITKQGIIELLRDEGYTVQQL